MRRTVLFIFGTRPEAIKLCPLLLKLKSFPDLYSAKVCVNSATSSNVGDYDPHLLSREELDMQQVFFKKMKGAPLTADDIALLSSITDASRQHPEQEEPAPEPASASSPSPAPVLPLPEPVEPLTDPRPKLRKGKA